jgi:hypothetical protein
MIDFAITNNDEIEGVNNKVVYIGQQEAGKLRIIELSLILVLSLPRFICAMIINAVREGFQVSQPLKKQC